jgi:hypothetical protein
MKATRPPHLPLSDLESILCDVSEMLGRFPKAAGVSALDGRIVQCRSAIAACRRHHFSPPLLRALSAKIIEVETDALVLRRMTRVPERAHSDAPEPGRAKRSRRKPPRRRE